MTMVSILVLLIIDSVTLEPIDVTASSDDHVSLHGILGIAFADELLYIRSAREAHIVVLEKNGRFVRRIGTGPFSYRQVGYDPPTGFSLQGRRMWIHGADGRMSYFESGSLLQTFHLESHSIDSENTTNAFAFDNEKVVIPCYPKTGHLAKGYDYGGRTLIDLGEIEPIDPEALKLNPGLNDTLWAADGRFFYCLWKHKPLVERYDKSGKRLSRIEIERPDADPVSSEPNGRPTPLYRDFLVSTGKIMALGSDGVLRIYDSSGSPSGAVWFRRTSATGSAFSPRTFAFDGKRTVFVGHPYLRWGHDLWKAKLEAPEK